MTVADQVKKAVETFTGVVFTVTTSTVYADGGYEFIFVNKRPIVSIGAIVDTQPVTPTTTTASAYDFFPERGSIYLKSGASWSPGQRRKWKITLDHGYAAVPDDVQLAIDTWVAAIGDNPSGSLKSYKSGDDSETYADVGGMPAQVKSLLIPYQRKGL